MEINFLEELVMESEQKEEQQTEAYYDLLLLGIRKMQEQIEYNFAEAEKECLMINSFILSKNAQLQEKIRWFELKLEAFIKERGERTIALANGTLKMHKKQDKVEIEDLELFLKKAKSELLNIIPEQVKPDLNKIKAFIKTRPVPPGVKVLEGQVEFSYKLNGVKEDGREKTPGAGGEQTSNLRVVV